MLWEKVDLPDTAIAHYRLSIVELATVIVDRVLSLMAGSQVELGMENRWRSRSSGDSPRRRRKESERGPAILSLLVAALFQSDCRRELPKPAAKGKSND
jgi:hypothetical protein